MDVNQLNELLAVAEHVTKPFQSALHEASWREEFRRRFNAETCAGLIKEIFRLREDIRILTNGRFTQS